MNTRSQKSPVIILMAVCNNVVVLCFYVKHEYNQLFATFKLTD